MSLCAIIAIVGLRPGVLYPAISFAIIAIRCPIHPIAFPVKITRSGRGIDARRVPAIILVVESVCMAAIGVRFGNLVGDDGTANRPNYGTKRSVPVSSDDVAKNTADSSAGNGRDNTV